MAKYVIDEKTLTDIADSIRQKKGTTADITPENMPSEIECITGGGEVEDLDAVLTEQEALIAELQDILAKKAVSGGGSYNFEWARGYEIEIGANSIKNSTDTVAYIKTLVDSYSTSLIILMSPLTVNNQLVLCGVSGVARCRDGKIASTAVGTAYDMFIPEGAKYLVLEKQG